MTTFTCSGCGKQFQVAYPLGGQKVRCPHCATIMPMPPGEASGAPTTPRVTVPSQPAASSPPTMSAETLPPATGIAPGATAAYMPNTTPATTGAGPAGNVTVAGFEVLGELGRGGMGVVYQARQLQPRRLVALKMILSAEHASPEHLARFRTEAAAAARLQHPSIVQVHEVREEAGRPILILEYIAGGNLAHLLAKEQLEPTRAAELVRQLARAVAYAHQRGVVHRDLKPANILLQPQTDGAGGLPWLPKVADFGLAKHLEGLTSIAAGPATQSGAILGTPSYMAPEQVRGKSKEVGPAADVYALGAILYECLTGKPPFHGRETIDILMQVATEEPAPPRRQKPGLPRDLETICLKCLAKEPARRYASADELAEDLRRFLAGEPIKARRQGPAEQALRWARRHKELAYLFSGVAAACLLTSLVLLSLSLVSFVRRETADAEFTELVPERVFLPPDLDMIPRDVLAFASIRVADLWAVQNPLGPAAAPFWGDDQVRAETQKALDKLGRDLMLTPEDVERCTLVLPNLDPIIALDDQSVDGPVVLLAFKKPYNWERVKKFVAQFQQFEDRARGSWIVYEAGREKQLGGLGLYHHNDRILLLGRGVDIARFLDRGAAHLGGPLQEALELAAGKHHYVLGVSPPRKDLEYIQKLTKNAIAPALLEVQAGTLRLDLVPPARSGGQVAGLDAELRLAFADGKAAAVGKTAAADLLREGLKLYDKSPLARDLPPLVKLLLKPLRQAAWKLEGEAVTLTALVRWQDKDMAATALWAATQRARQQSFHNLNHLGVAMQSYHDQYRALPPAVLRDKQTGKPLLSWRVAILPFLGEGKLYEQFKLDQPWDDPANLALLNKMPAVFRAPRFGDGKARPEDTTRTPYQVVVGPHTAFDPTQPVTIHKMNLSDGSANTIVIVEGAWPVPWTKPEDVTFDDAPLWPRLGGLFADGFHAALGDGSVYFFPRAYTEAQLRALITYDDGMVVPLPKE